MSDPRPPVLPEEDEQDRDRRRIVLWLFLLLLLVLIPAAVYFGPNIFAGLGRDPLTDPALANPDLATGPDSAAGQRSSSDTYDGSAVPVGENARKTVDSTFGLVGESDPDKPVVPLTEIAWPPSGTSPLGCLLPCTSDANCPSSLNVVYSVCRADQPLCTAPSEYDWYCSDSGTCNHEVWCGEYETICGLDATDLCPFTPVNRTDDTIVPESQGGTCGFACAADADCAGMSCLFGICWDTQVCLNLVPGIIPQAGSPPTSDACATNGGAQWSGEICLCTGFIDQVTICQDGTKLDNLTGVACSPDPAACTGAALPSGPTAGGSAPPPGEDEVPPPPGGVEIPPPSGIDDVAPPVDVNPGLSPGPVQLIPLLPVPPPTCGNSVIEIGESCDNSACPQTGYVCNACNCVPGG